jgi:hypothetical protein
MSREQLREVLVNEKGLAETVWTRTLRLLEFIDLVQFASSVGAVSESTARADLQKWVGEAEGIIRALERETVKQGSTHPSTVHSSI